MPDRIEIDTDALLKKNLIKLAQVEVVNKLVKEYNELYPLIDAALESEPKADDKKPGRIKQAALALDAKARNVKSGTLARWLGIDVKGFLELMKDEELKQKIRESSLRVDLLAAQRALESLQRASNSVEVGKSIEKAARSLMNCKELISKTVNTGKKADFRQLVSGALMGAKAPSKEGKIKLDPTAHLGPQQQKAAAAAVTAAKMGGAGDENLTTYEKLKERYKEGGLKPITPQSSGGSTTSTKSATSANTSGRSRADSNSSTGSSSGMNKPPPPVPSTTTEGVKPPLPNKRPPGPSKN